MPGWITEGIADYVRFFKYEPESHRPHPKADKATYHDSCAGLRECKIKEEPRKLLSRVKGLQLLEMNDVETCCGFGGSFAVKFESISVAMADQKVNNALQTGADYIISTDISCLMHLDGYIRYKGHSIRTMHIADVLANS